MKLLVVEWGAYTQEDINETFLAHHIQFKTISYCFGDKNNDDFFYNRFYKYASAENYDAVFTVNYFPLVAKVCYDLNIKYLSWSYDNPLNVPYIEATLAYSTNYVFLFDKKQVAFYQQKGFVNIYHLPLAINPSRLSEIAHNTNNKVNFKSDISFVGKLYPSLFSSLLSQLDSYEKGYLEAIAQAQFRIYGYYFIDDFLTDTLLTELNLQFHKSNPGFSITKEQLSYAMATYVTRQERITLLNLLAKKHLVTLYSREIPDILSDVTFKGSANYLKEMPYIFYHSKINLNITLKILQTGIPLRVLDILGSGGFLLSNYQEEIVEHFIPDEDIVIYADIQDALDKAEYYLTHEESRKRIALSGQQKAYDTFNYSKQLTYLLTTAGLL